MCCTREVVTRRRIPFTEQDAILDELVRRYRPIRICMDQTGMGEKPVEDAKRRYGELGVEGVLFTAAAKQHLANLAREAFEDRKVRIPEGDEAVRADLHSLRRVVTPTGNVRFDVDGGDGHADRAWAAFLGIYAAHNHTGPIEYAAAGRCESLTVVGDHEPALQDEVGFGAVAGLNDFEGF